MLNFMKHIDGVAQRITDPLVPFLLLFTRLWVAWVFFKSGMVKYSSWDSTLYLFEFEYQVPLLPWQLAAYMGTTAELILPVFLVLGCSPVLWHWSYSCLILLPWCPIPYCGRKVFSTTNCGA